MRRPRSQLTLFLLAGLIGPAAAEAKSWTSIGPFGDGGQVLSLAVDPRSASTVYAGNGRAAGGRLFKTTDAGATWQPLEEGLPPVPVLTIAIDPVDPETVYVGLEVYSGPGLFKSENAGRIWRPASVGLPVGRQINALAIDPTAPRVLYAGSSTGGAQAFKSIDAGETWRRISNGLSHYAPTCLAIDPQNPRTIYAGAVFVGIFKSTDAGENWAPSSNGLAQTTIDALAVDPNNPSTVYAGSSAGVSKSTDRGDSWSLQNQGLPQFASIHVLAIHPSIPNTVFAAGGGRLFKSTDGSANWTEKDAGFSPFSQVVTSVAIAAASPGFIYTGTHAYAAGDATGVVRSSDGGETWHPANGNLRTFRMQKVLVSPGFPPVLYAATEEDGVFRSSDGGGSWSPANVGLSDLHIRDLALDPSSPQTLYATNYAGVFKTVNGGAAWVPANRGVPSSIYLQNLAVDPTSPATIYASSDGVFKSVNGAESWLQISNASIGKIAIHPSSPGTLYGAGYESELLKSVDGGKSWITILGGGCLRVDSIAIDPRNPSNLFVATSFGCPTPNSLFIPGRILRSKDAGASWIDITNGLIVFYQSDVAIIPGNPSVVHLSTGTSVYRSLDEGTSWLRHGDELPYTSSLALDRNTPPQALFVGTLGASVMKASVSAGFHTTTPCRVIDTREPTGSHGGPALASGVERRFQIAGRCGVPRTARAVSFNFTVAGSSHAGALRVYPPGGNSVPTASTVSYLPGRAQSNNAIVALSLDGEVAVRCFEGSGTVHLIADINGYFE